MEKGSEMMQDSPERRHLEEVLKHDKAGSAKIRGLTDYLMLTDLQWRLAYERQDLSEEEIHELRSRKGFMIQHSWLQSFKEDADEYISAYEGACELMKPYIDKYIDEGKLAVLLNCLREINREKSKK
jgi:hypothetical protein